MKFVLSIALLMMSAPSVMAFPFSDGGPGQTVAFACINCDFNAAEHIAIQNAPKNTCSIYRTPPNAAYCESVSQTILIPVHDTRNVFKFNVTTSIDSQNRPVVSVDSFFPVNTLETALMSKYLDFYEEFELAVRGASITSEELLQPAVFSTNASSPASVTENDECSSHPTHYFKNLGNKRSIRGNLADRIQLSIGGDSGAEYSNEALINSGSLDVSLTGGAVSVGMQYIENSLVVTRGDSFENRLAFDVNVFSDPTSGNNALFSLTLNTSLTKIDGFKYSELFGGGNVDLSNTIISNCLVEFLKSGDAVSDTPTSGGGDGTLEDPFVGIDVGNSNTLWDFCGYTETIRTCIDNPNGTQSCVESTYSFVARCGSY
jgi:hypothetical protein